MPGAHERTTALKKIIPTKRYELIMVDFYNPTISTIEHFLGDIIIINTSVSANFP